jgi:hypothetical protein
VTDRCIVCHQPLSPLRVDDFCETCAVVVLREVQALLALDGRARWSIAAMLYDAGTIALARVVSGGYDSEM